jgi:ribosomal protein S18 acetylase RimI-like enzyme
MKFMRLSLEEDFNEYWPILRQLRPHLDRETTLSWGKDAELSDGYTLLGVRDHDGQLIGLMGYRWLHDFVHGPHLYIDDLVIDEAQRSKGAGASLLREAERIAQEKGWKMIRLCTGLENKEGRRFYEREGYSERAVACKKRLN